MPRKKKNCILKKLHGVKNGNVNQIKISSEKEASWFRRNVYLISIMFTWFISP